MSIMTRFIMGTGAYTMVLALTMIVGYLALEGAAVIDLDYFLDSPLDQGLEGGIGLVILNTFLIVLPATALALVFGGSFVLVDVLLADRVPAASHFLRNVIQVGVSIPRLVWGLVGAVTLGQVFGYSVLTGILTLAALLTPLAAVNLLLGLDDRVGSILSQTNALGIDSVRGLFSFVVPLARPVVLVTVLSTLGRGLGDAAALMLTAGFGTHIITSWFDTGSTLATHAFFLAITVPGGIRMAAACALVLIAITAVLHLLIILCNRQS